MIVVIVLVLSSFLKHGYSICTNGGQSKKRYSENYRIKLGKSFGFCNSGFPPKRTIPQPQAAYTSSHPRQIWFHTAAIAEHLVRGRINPSKVSIERGSRPHYQNPDLGKGLQIIGKGQSLTPCLCFLFSSFSFFSLCQILFFL